MTEFQNSFLKMLYHKGKNSQNEFDISPDNYPAFTKEGFGRTMNYLELSGYIDISNKVEAEEVDYPIEFLGVRLTKKALNLLQ